MLNAERSFRRIKGYKQMLLVVDVKTVVHKPNRFGGPQSRYESCGPRR
jgi:hypothetical protein